VRRIHGGPGKTSARAYGDGVRSDISVRIVDAVAITVQQQIAADRRQAACRDDLVLGVDVTVAVAVLRDQCEMACAGVDVSIKRDIAVGLDLGVSVLGSDAGNAVDLADLDVLVVDEVQRLSDATTA